MIWLGAQVTIWVTFAAVWNAAAETCDTRQANRLFPLFAAAGIGGGVLGNVATGPLAAALGTENLLVVQSAILAAAVVFVMLGRPFFTEQRGTSSVLSALGDGVRVARRDPLMRLATVAAIALNALFYLVVFPFSSVVAASFDGEAELAGFLGFFSAAATALTFVFSLLVTGRLLARLGVVRTLAIVPSVHAAGFALWLGVFDLDSAVAFRGVQWVAVNAILAPVWTSLFNVFTGRRRTQSLAFVALPTQLGVIVSGAVLVLVPAAASPRPLFIAGLALAALALFLVLRMRPRYQEGLISSVRVGVMGLFAAPAAVFRNRELDADLERTVTASLDDPSPRTRGCGDGNPRRRLRRPSRFSRRSRSCRRFTRGARRRAPRRRRKRACRHRAPGPETSGRRVGGRAAGCHPDPHRGSRSIPRRWRRRWKTPTRWFAPVPPRWSAASGEVKRFGTCWAPAPRRRRRRGRRRRGAAPWVGACFPRGGRVAGGLR